MSLNVSNPIYTNPNHGNAIRTLSGIANMLTQSQGILIVAFFFMVFGSLVTIFAQMMFRAREEKEKNRIAKKMQERKKLDEFNGREVRSFYETKDAKGQSITFKDGSVIAFKSDREIFVHTYDS